MDKDVIAMYISGILGLSLIIISLVIFGVRWKRYKYVGNHFLYALFALALCFGLALMSNIFPPAITETIKVNGETKVIEEVHEAGDFSRIASSFFEAIKMLGLGFDRDKVSFYFDQFLKPCYLHYNLFGAAYILSSALGLFYTSLFIALTLFNNAVIKVKTFFKNLCPSKQVYYLFSDSNVTITAKLAEELQRDGHIVVIYLSRASQLTQAGTEYKDNLITKGFDVRIESYGAGLIEYLFGKTFNKYFNPIFRLLRFGKRKVRVFGLFSDDETSVELASHFKKAIVSNKHFAEIRRKIYCSEEIYSTEERGKKFEARLNNPNFAKYLSDGFCTDEEKKEGQSLLVMLSNTIGISEVANTDEPDIKEYIEDNQLGDSDFPLLFNHFLRNDFKIKRIIAYSETRIKEWLDLLNEIKSKKIKPHEMGAINNYRVFLTYQESDIDTISHYSDSTLHMVNTLSQYDMISTEFILANQLTNFIDISRFNQVDKNNQEVDITNDSMHVTFFGFGKINRPIFEKMSSAYQLWHDNKNKVHYHIVDREANARRDSVLNRYCGGSYTPFIYKEGSVVEEEDRKKLLPPQLFDVTAECDGEDLLDYNTIEEYIDSIFLAPNRFSKDGFEVFVVSIINTMSDIEIANSIRKAILKCYNANKNNPQGKKEKSLDKTIIFVRIANRQTVDSYFSNSAFVKDQKYIDDGLLFNRETNSTSNDDDVWPPIVIFGENALMSTYISKHLETITYYAIEALSSYDDVDHDRAARKWLLLDKKKALSNIATVYSLKSKIALLGHKIDSNYNIKTNPAKFQDFLDNNLAFSAPYNLDSYDQKMLHLAGLEHNRWMAAVLQIYKYSQMPVDEFVSEENKFNSKTKDGTAHVCMISNEGLKVLRKIYQKESPTSIEESWNLTMVYDIRAMKKIFESLNKEYQNNLKKAKKGKRKKAPQTFRNDPISK